jgi:DNA mismatch repair protein MutS2
MLIRWFFDIADVLRCARTVKAYMRYRKHIASGLFSALHANKYLEEKITVSIIGEEKSLTLQAPKLPISEHIRAATPGSAIFCRVHFFIRLSEGASGNRSYESFRQVCDSRLMPNIKVRSGLVHDISSAGQTCSSNMQVVSANTEIRELQAKDKKEIERILMSCMRRRRIILRTSHDFSLLTSLDLIFCKSKAVVFSELFGTEISDRGAAFQRASHR